MKCDWCGAPSVIGFQHAYEGAPMYYACKEHSTMDINELEKRRKEKTQETRNKICVLGKATRDGRLIVPSALSYDNEPKPIMCNYDLITKDPLSAESKLWGKFSNIVERDGALYAESIEPELPEDWCLTLDVQIKDAEIENGTLIIRKGRILGAHLSPVKSWPWD